MPSCRLESSEGLNAGKAFPSSFRARVRGRARRPPFFDIAYKRSGTAIQSRTMDVGGYWTTAPGANYGLLGGEFKYAFLRESARVPAAAVSTSFTMLTGVPDFNLSIYSVGLVASKRIAMFTPYWGVKEVLVIGTETTAKVDLNRESLPLTQGFIGATCSIWKLGLAAEYNIADVNTFAFVIGFHPRVHLHYWSEMRRENLRGESLLAASFWFCRASGVPPRNCVKLAIGVAARSLRRRR